MNDENHKRKFGDGCQGCVFRRKISGNGSSLKVCNYLIDTGKVRGCPPGEGCKRYCNDPKIKKKLLAESKKNWGLL